ncbi:hypothetical protein [Pseudanabaena sp. 'Roaring Creek']|nr:hypothetical protein [Pseudanabaena sp. 'Roaring Creek']
MTHKDFCPRDLNDALDDDEISIFIQEFGIEPREFHTHNYSDEV